jgi:hypothetical protein
MKNNNNSIVVVMLGAVIVLLLALLVNQVPLIPSAHAQTSSGTGDMIAVTGNCGGGMSCLWVIKKGESGEQLALYTTSSGGRNLTFVGARRIAYDLKLIDYNDRTVAKYKVTQLKKDLEKYNKKK